MVKPQTNPCVPCMDVAGIVVEIGAKVSKLAVGDRVVGDIDIAFQGTMAEYCIAPEKYLAKVPQSLALLEVVGGAMAGVTSLQALRRLGVTNGTRLVVRGASGGTGSLAVQLAKILGASEICAISSQVELCRSLGATQIVNYKEEKCNQIIFL
jgi:NADPH:quinone reductase-like Zn-dependent oxidoreductase